MSETAEHIRKMKFELKQIEDDGHIKGRPDVFTYYFDMEIALENLSRALVRNINSDLEKDDKK